MKRLLLMSMMLFWGITTYALSVPAKSLIELTPAPTTIQANDIELQMLGFFNLDNGVDHSKIWQQGLGFCVCGDTELMLKTPSGTETIEVTEGKNLILNPLDEYEDYGPYIQLYAGLEDVNLIILEQPMLDINSPQTRLCYDEDGPGGEEPQIFFTGNSSLISAAYGVERITTQDTTGTFDQTISVGINGFDYHPSDSTTVVDPTTLGAMLSTVAGDACLPCTTLPIILHDWNINTDCNGVKISWDVADAIGGVFHLQFSEDGISYQTIAQIEADETNEFFHEIRFDGTAYYRIKIFETDGSHWYSNLKSGIQNCVGYINGKDVIVWGTKTTGQSVILRGFDNTEELTAEIYSVTGQKLISKSFTPDSELYIIFDETDLSQLSDNELHSIVVSGNRAATLAVKLIR